MPLGRTVFAWMVALVLVAQPLNAHAQFDPIVDRNYTLDLYQGAVVGSVRIVGMGGAAIALAQGSASIKANPAAPAVRSATSKGKWDWDWHVDWLSPELGADFDNNGIETTDDDLSTQPIFTIGLVVNYKHWAIGANATWSSATVGTDNGEVVEPQALVGNFSIARSFKNEEYTAGIGIRTGQLSIKRGNQDLFVISGAALEGGFVWRPPQMPLRLGASASAPVSGRQITASTECPDPMDCFGYILPEEVKVPWQVGIGAGWRFARSQWNRRVKDSFRDERALTLAADVVLTGNVKNGHGVEAFVQKQLQRSGRKVAVSLRGGAEYEWFPGRLRLRAGSYWEPSRFEGVPGRIHVTGGMELSFYNFKFWGDPYRLRLSLIFDGAKRYGNAGISIGFWH